mmetsp:Transcript_16986/g.32866  ORF Transcript_16986/g.32866 Transcript_16986/m.32866 type:complete len:215 (+) Transcript_16986:121-765(+)
MAASLSAAAFAHPAVLRPASGLRRTRTHSASLRPQQKCCVAKIDCESRAEEQPNMSASHTRRALGLMSASVPWALAFTWTSQAAPVAEECEYKTSASGIQWCDLREGAGEAPEKGETISAHYTGKLASNGFKFDSSYDRGSPLKFQVGVGRVIRGWDEGIIGGEGIPGMKPGGKRRLLIPSDLGYGKRGAGGGLIPPDADLLFDVELVRMSKFK